MEIVGDKTKCARKNMYIKIIWMLFFKRFSENCYAAKIIVQLPHILYYYKFISEYTFVVHKKELNVESPSSLN